MEKEKSNEMKIDNESKENNYISLGMSIGMCFGMSIGTAIGILTDNIPIFMCIGLSVGMILGLAFGSGIKQNKEKNNKK